MVIKNLKELYPEDWTEYKFNDLFKFDGGMALSRAKLSNEGICYLHYGDIHKSKDNYIDVEKSFDSIPKINTSIENINDKYILNDGDIVFADASEDYEGIGKSVVIINKSNIPFVSGLHTIIARDKKSLLDNSYKRFFLSDWNIRKQIMILASGISVYGISRENIKSVKVFLPPLREQKKIAAILATWDKAIELKEKLIEQKKELKKGLMQKLLTGEVRVPGFNGEWKEYRLGTLSEISTGNKDTKDKVENGSYPFFVRSEKIERINSYSYDGEAILIPGDGNVGKIYHYINGKFDFHQRVYKISDFNNKCIGKFIYYYLQQYFYREAMKYSAKATVDSLRLPMLTDMIIRLPEIPEQIAIVKILDAADKEISFLNQELEKLNLQKKGLMQLLLTGKVRVKV